MKTLPVTVNVPEILNVPLVNVKKAIGVPSVVVPCTVKFDVFNSRVLALDVPLLMVIVRMSVVAPVPLNVLLAAPVKVMLAPAVLALVLKSSTPLLVKSVPIERTWPVCVPAGLDWNVPPLFMVADCPTVKVLAVVVSNCNVAPV